MKGINRVIRGHVFAALLNYCQGRGAKKGEVPEGRLMMLPLAAGYGVETFLSTDPASI